MTYCTDRLIRLKNAALKIGLAPTLYDVKIWAQSPAALPCNGFTPDQIAYLAERGAAHGITATDVLSMMDPDIASVPDLAIAKLHACELSHVISQVHAPAMAHDPSNIVLEVADGTNQARGAADMTTHDRLNVEMHSEAQDAQLLHYAIPHASFQDVWNLFGDITRNVCRGVFIFGFVEKATWKKTITLGQEIINDFPHLHDPAVRQKAVDRLAAHIDYCAGKADCHTAFLMALLLANAPWASSLLAAKGLCTLAKMAMTVAKEWANRIFRNQHLAWARKFFHDTLSIMESILDAALHAITFVWNAIDSSIRYVADVVSKTYHKAKAFLTSIWNGLGSIFSWGQLSAA